MNEEDENYLELVAMRCPEVFEEDSPAQKRFRELIRAFLQKPPIKSDKVP
jgi:hypothetical protein